jgi:hypothetical protein
MMFFLFIYYVIRLFYLFSFVEEVHITITRKVANNLLKTNQLFVYHISLKRQKLKLVF